MSENSRKMHEGFVGPVSVQMMCQGLEEVLSSNLTADIVSGDIASPTAYWAVRGSLVEKWASGEVKPGVIFEDRIRTAYSATQILLKTEDQSTVRRWFEGLHPDFGYQAPKLFVAEKPRKVIRKAREFHLPWETLVT